MHLQKILSVLAFSFRTDVEHYILEDWLLRLPPLVGSMLLLVSECFIVTTTTEYWSRKSCRQRQGDGMYLPAPKFVKSHANAWPGLSCRS